MNSSQLVHLLIQQTWQVAMLACLVWIVTRYIGRDRAHLKHMLWALVLIKCLTPPMWSSPMGLFSLGADYVARWNLSASSANQERKPIESIFAKDVTTVVRVDSNRTALPSSPLEAPQGSEVWWSRIISSCLGIWIVGCLGFFGVTILRWRVFIREVVRTEVPATEQLQMCVQRLKHKLEVRRRVRVKVVRGLLGPAVFGLWSPTILLPLAIVDGRSNKELEPLIAHEMVHIRRGDLWLALIQVLACSLGWFHPLVWLASRRLTIESERCCDEETIARLKCQPATYARSLLDVLEWKHLLRVAPALPGVRPVDITSSRLERIMRLGQGCRRRSPWWIHAVAIVCGAMVLPGARYLEAQTSPSPETVLILAQPTPVKPELATEELLMLPLSMVRTEAQDRDVDVSLVQVDVQIFQTLASSELAKHFEGVSVESRGRAIPILSDLPYLGRLFKRQPVLILSSDESITLVEKVITPSQPICLSSPSLLIPSGIDGTIEISASPSQDEAEVAGITLEIQPTVIDKGLLRVSLELTKTNSTSQGDGTQLAADDVVPWTVHSTVEMAPSQTMVIASQPNDKGILDLVLVNVSIPKSDHSVAGAKPISKIEEGNVLWISTGDGDAAAGTGHPFVVRDGRIHLPLLPPLSVAGLTLEEAKKLIAETYQRVLGAAKAPAIQAKILR